MKRGRTRVWYQRELLPCSAFLEVRAAVVAEKGVRVRQELRDVTLTAGPDLTGIPARQLLHIEFIIDTRSCSLLHKSYSHITCANAFGEIKGRNNEY